MKCPSCGGAELVNDTRDLIHTYKGESTTIYAVKGDYCPACGESVSDVAESRRVMAQMLAFNKQINAKDNAPQFIQQTRQKLQLTQKEAGEIFGGGVNAFSRYETGKATPPIALLKLFRLLDKHPEYLAEIR